LVSEHLRLIYLQTDISTCRSKTWLISSLFDQLWFKTWLLPLRPKKTKVFAKMSYQARPVGFLRTL
jgi:hypothetical protein